MKMLVFMLIAFTTAAKAELVCKAYCVKTSERVQNNICRNVIRSYITVEAEGRYRTDILANLKASCSGQIYSHLALPPGVSQIGTGQCLPLGEIAGPDDMDCDLH